MILKGKDLKTLDNLRNYVEQNLNGFNVLTDELTGEIVIRTYLISENDGTLTELVAEKDGRNLNDGRLIDFEEYDSDLI